MLGACAIAVLTLPLVLSDAQVIFKQHQCNRCHAVAGLASPRRDLDCSGCHRDIAGAQGDPRRMAQGRRQYGQWDRFVERTSTHFQNLPPLDRMDRFRADWLRAFLRRPHDIRPNLGESMFPTRLSDGEIETLVTSWRSEQPRSAAPPDAGRLAEGARLFDEKGCGTCHLLGGRAFIAATGFQFRFLPELRPRALAPDLQHARARMNRDTVARLIREPVFEMPRLDISAEESSLLADFVYFTPIEERPLIQRRPPAYDPEAKVPSYEEVDALVFRAVCIHCHGSPDLGPNDPGPGVNGGFGFPALRLSFASYVDVMNGSIDTDGNAQSIFRIGKSGEPVLLERLRRRYVEATRDQVRPGGVPATISDGPPGMPLGLPALTDEQFSLVERWVRGGRPAPSH
jgi:mono/diheme cytochrome c family protein